MTNNTSFKEYNPDVLSTLANLSSDEVFTPPEVVNEMLDLLPNEIWKNKNTKFLDPSAKSGVFLREIAKRLITGLEEEIPVLQERIDHIFQKQLFGIAITELTSLLSRRSIYGSKYPNSIFSFSSFDNPKGNIEFNNIKHTWFNNKCTYCGASKEQYGDRTQLEYHAYEFIHTLKPKEIFNMKFDVIIGNPPYQLSTGGAQAQATPLYDKFITQSIKMNPKYLVMIVPSRWFTGGFGLKKFREDMLNDKRMRKIVDFENAAECFPGVEIKGGVNYFLWDRDYNGDTTIKTIVNSEVVSSMKRPLLEDGLSVFIRDNNGIPILKKSLLLKEKRLMETASSQRPFGLPTNFKNYVVQKNKNTVKIYANRKQGYTNKNNIMKNIDLIDKWKVITPKAIGSGNMKDDWVNPILAEPGSACTETYIVLYYSDSKINAENFISYTQTKFFHFLLGLKKNTQDALRGAYEFIPHQDYTISWSDEQLYKKYNLTDTEINYINNSVKNAED